MNLILTKKAEKYIKKYIKYKKNIIGIYIYINKSGCAGFTYKIKFIKKNNFKKFFLNINNIIIFIDNNIKNIINNTKIDYIKDGLNNKLTIINFNSKYICGCGKSFSI